MTRIFLNSIIDKKYLLIYVFCTILFILSFSLISNSIVNNFNNNEIFYTNIDIFKNVIFPISLNNYESILLAFSRELIFFVMIFYPIIKIIDFFLNYMSSIFFSKIGRKEWLNGMYKIILGYILIICLIYILFDFVIYIINYKDFSNIIFIPYLFLLKIGICLSTIYLYFSFITYINDSLFGLIISIIFYLVSIILVNLYMLSYSFINLLIFLISICMFIYTLYQFSKKNILIIDVGGI